MGAKKRRQDGDSSPGTTSGGHQPPGPGGSGGSENQCSSCCNNSTSFGGGFTDENNNIIGDKSADELKRDGDGDGENKEISQDKDSRESEGSSRSLFSQAWRKFLGSSKRKKTQSSSKSSNLLVVGVIVIIVASSTLVYRPVQSVCVWQGGGGFKVACGFRQSGLFRIRSIGGIKGYIGGGFTIGDEDGFKDSLTNMEGQQGGPQSGPYVIPNNVNTQRSLPSGPVGPFVSQYQAIQEHPLPIPTGDPAAQQNQRIQYLDNIQHQLEVDHKELQMQAMDQQSQKQLEQQMLIQGGIIPPVPTAKVKRAETGGLTKRASLWNWNIFGRGKNNNQNGKNGKKPNKNGPGPGHPPSPAQRRGGPPHQHQHQNQNHGNKQHGKPGGRWDRRGKNKPPPPPPGRRDKQRGPGGPPPGPPGSNGGPGGRLRGMTFPKNPHELKNMAENFLGHMKNPFSHLQDNFMGKPNSREVKSNFNRQQNSNFPIMAQRKEFNTRREEKEKLGPAFPSFAPQLQMFPPRPQGSSSSSMERMRQVPQQSMMPPPPSPMSMDIPKFKKLPNNQKSQEDNGDYMEEDEGPPPQMMEDHEGRPVDRMMPQMPEMNDDYNHDLPPPPPHEFYRTSSSHETPVQAPAFPSFPGTVNDPAGLKMLKRTENFGTIFHLVNPDGSPVNMQFEKQPIIPPGIQFSPQQQQDLADALVNGGFGFSQEQQAPQQQLPPPTLNENDLDLLGGLGQIEPDSPLATAVYDPNIFPDIYFTTTEKHKNDYPRSQEVLDNPNIILSGNHLKRILGSSEKSGAVSNAVRKEFVNKVVAEQQKAKSLEQQEQDQETEIVLVPARRKVRRRKKFRQQQQQLNNQIDTNESDNDVSSSTPSTPKRRRKGRRKKKYKLATTPRTHEASSTERMGQPANNGGEQTSSENVKTESPRVTPLTTTQAPSTQPLRGSPPRNKTSFSLPSGEIYLTGPSSENKIDVGPTTIRTTSTSSTEDPTTRIPFSYSTFGYIDALRNRQGNPLDYDFSGPEDEYGGGYDPRFPPDHEVNRGHNMTKFIRPRGPGFSTTIPDASTDMPFILYDMVGTRNQSRFSSKFHKDVSPFKLDSDLETENHQNDVRRNDENNPGGQFHPFHQNNQKSDKNVYMKFDSNEWGGSDHNRGNYRKDDVFSNHYNRTSYNSGYYNQGHSKEYGPSAELPWHRRDYTGSTTSVPTPIYPVGYGSNEIQKSKFFKNPSSSSSIEHRHDLFGPTMETFGLPKQTTPYESSGEKRKLHKNLFGGSSADVSDLGDWASPNFWGNLQDTGRYRPNADLDDMRRTMDHNTNDHSNGLKEMSPHDLSIPTPVPVPSPSPSQNTMEDLLDDFLAPSHPGGKWGKQRRRKQKGSPTAAPGTTPTPNAVPLVMSTIVTSIPVSSSTSTQAPAKWLAISNNEVDMIPPDLGTSILAASIEQDLRKAKGNKKGVEIKFRSGEERDPQEEEARDQGIERLDKNVNVQAQNATNKMGYHDHEDSYPGVMVHDFDSDQGYGYGEHPPQQQHHHPQQHQHQPPPRGGVHSSEYGYYPSDGASAHGVDKPRSEVPMNVYHHSNEYHDHHDAPHLQHPPPPHSHHERPAYIPVQHQQHQPPHQHPPPHPPKEFQPSAEDLGPLNLPQKGLPSHQDNPFKQFEKQDIPVNSPGMGFVSTKHEFTQMINQIQKFAPDDFFKRDSSEMKSGGSALPVRGGGGMNGNPAEFPKPPQGGGGPPPQPSDIPEFGPSGFPNNLREPEHAPPMGMGQEKEGNREHSSVPPTAHSPGFLKGPKDAPWDMRPLENNDVGDPERGHHHPPPPPPHGSHPPHQHERHPPPGGNRPHHNFEDEMRRPPPPPPPQHEREREMHPHDRPPHGHMRHPPHRDEHDNHRPPPGPQNRPPPPHSPHRDERPMRPPPPPPPPRDRDHDRPPHGRHDYPPPPGRGPPGPPPGHREHDRRPHEFERDFPPPRRDEGHPPPRHHEDRFRDGPRGPPPPGPPPRGHDSRQPPPGPPPRKEEHDRKNHDDHKIEHLRPPPPGPPHFHDRPHEHNGDHSSHGKWRDEKDHRPPPPHGHPDFKEVQIIPHHPNNRPIPLGKSHKPPPPPPPKKVAIPFAKIPLQMFKPPPPPPGSHPPSKPGPPQRGPPPQHQHQHHMPPPPPKSRGPPPPPPPVNPTRKPSIPINSDPIRGSELFSQTPYHDQPSRADRDRERERDRDRDNHNNYINSYNDRYDPPPPQKRPQDLRPPPPPPMHPHPDQTGGNSRLPHLPFPMPGGTSFETSFIDLDQDPHAHLLPEDRNPKLPPPQPTHPVYRPPGQRQKADAKMDEKKKLIDAFETLNKANYDVIQSLAAEKYGPDLIDRVKTKSNMFKPESKPLPLRVETLPVVTSTTPQPKPNANNVLAVLATKQPLVQEETAKLAELLKMINKPSPQPVAAAVTMPQKQNADPLSNLLQKLANNKPAPTTPAPTNPPPTRRLPEMPSNPGLLSLTSALNPGPTHDVKSLQAQIAKAIIAKAHSKNQNEVLQQQQPPPPQESPLQMLQQLAQNRNSLHTRNYTASQIETLKKLIALNDIEQKLNQPPPTLPPPPPPTTEDPLRKLQALLPAAISAAARQKQQQQQHIPSNTISRKMLDTSTANSLAHHHNNHNLLQKLSPPDPTLLALKAIALSKAQGVHPQPTLSLPQQAMKQQTEADSQPIAVDLSAILSPSPPVVEASRKRRLTNVRNAPKSFFPANATQGFEDFNMPLLTEFRCDEQNFFPGLYADTELGCRVFHLCAKTEAGYMMKSFRCPKETVFDQEVLRCNWNLFVDCPKSRNKYHFNKYLSQSFQFLKILGEFSANYQKSDATMTG